MTKPECAAASVGLFSLGHLELRHSFVIRHWAFVIDFYQALASEHATAVLLSVGGKIEFDRAESTR